MLRLAVDNTTKAARHRRRIPWGDWLVVLAMMAASALTIGGAIAATLWAARHLIHR